MRRTLGPFPELRNLPPQDIATADGLDILERMDLLNQVLASHNCNCNGHAAGRQRDPYFGGDISELISRCTPYDVHGMDDDGKPTIQTVSINLETLTVEVDDNDELCVWMYEES